MKHVLGTRLTFIRLTDQFTFENVCSKCVFTTDENLSKLRVHELQIQGLIIQILGVTSMTKNCEKNVKKLVFHFYLLVMTLLFIFVLEAELKLEKMLFIVDYTYL